MGRTTWWLGLTLGILLLAAGVAETTRALVSGDGGLWFWTPTLVGGGGLMVVGTVLGRRSRRAGGVLTMVVAALGLLPTAWTLVVPVLLALLVVMTVREMARTGDTASPET